MKRLLGCRCSLLGHITVAMTLHCGRRDLIGEYPRGGFMACHLLHDEKTADLGTADSRRAADRWRE